MKTNRRNFLKHSGLAGIGLIGTSIIPAYSSSKDNYNDELGPDRVIKTAHTQKFNMSGYSAPKIDTVRIGFIGFGNRGPRHTANMSLLEGVSPLKVSGTTKYKFSTISCW